MAKTSAKSSVQHRVQIAIDGDIDVIDVIDGGVAASVAEALLSAAEHRTTVRVDTGQWHDGVFHPTGASVFDFASVRRVDVLAIADDGSTGSPPIKK